MRELWGIRPKNQLVNNIPTLKRKILEEEESKENDSQKFTYHSRSNSLEQRYKEHLLKKQSEQSKSLISAIGESIVSGVKFFAPSFVQTTTPGKQFIDQFK